MPIKLNFAEKCYLVALFGDMTPVVRERLFSTSSFPAQAGPQVMQEGYRFISAHDNGKLTVIPRKGRARGIASPYFQKLNS